MPADILPHQLTQMEWTLSLKAGKGQDHRIYYDLFEFKQLVILLISQKQCQEDSKLNVCFWTVGQKKREI